jgi:glycerophosphoryl diester phosphodiesterase
MAYLGYANPLRRLGGTILGWLKPPPVGHPRPSPFFIIGHAGAPEVAPENTIPSFVTAIEQGANAIETDVCVTQDGHFILWHDADPNGAVTQLRQFVGVGPYVSCLPPVGSPWRQPVAALDLAAVRTHFGYTRRESTSAALAAENATPEVPIALFEDLIAWVQLERRVQHLFLDLKLTPEQSGSAVALLDRLRHLYSRQAMRDDLRCCLLSPQVEVVEALAREARRLTLPPAIKLYADFELPGVLSLAPRLGIRHASMGSSRRLWVDFRREVSQVIIARDRGRLDSVIAWTVNDEAQLRELMQLGVNGIITDQPARLQQIVATFQTSPGSDR